MTRHGFGKGLALRIRTLLPFRAPRAGATPAPDARLLRRVRWRLIVWSGGSTLILVFVLGALLYSTTAERLRTESVAQLEVRAKSLQPADDAFVGSVPLKNRMTLKITSDATTPGFLLGGPASGTIAFVMPVGGPDPEAGAFGGATMTKDGPTGPATGLDPGVLAQLASTAATAAAQGERTIQDVEIGGAPFRVLSIPADVGDQRLVIGVIGDRSAEVRTLQTLLFMLVLGGLAVIAGAALLGSVYAGRALVPIRDSLRRQREFAADASHELRTPLAIVTGATEELRRSAGDPGATDRAVADIEAGTKRLTGLVNDLLFLARADSDVVEVARDQVDLGEVSAETASGFEVLAREHAARLRLDIQPAPVVGDAARLGELVGILLDNAIRHSPASGVVTIRVRPGAQLEVEDDGRGLRPDEMDEVFRRFWRAPDAPAGGTGLGLSIADSIVRAHGGRIRAANRPEGGARFTVTLPAART